MDLDPRLHFVVATAIIVKDGKFLIAKRADWEKAFPNKWTVPGGKLVRSEYEAVPKTTENCWYDVIDWLLKKEVKEEVNLEIGRPQYVTDLTFIRPDGYPVITLSYWAPYAGGEVKLNNALTDYAWVNLEEAKNYDLIDGIYDELKAVDAVLKK